MSNLPEGFVLDNTPIKPETQVIEAPSGFTIDSVVPEPVALPETVVGDSFDAFGDRLGGLANKRTAEVSQTFEDYAKGDISLGSAMLQTVGKGGFATAGDFIAESVSTGVGAVLPDEIKEPIKQFAGEMIGKVLDSDVANSVADEWNKLDDATQKNLESTGAIMSFLLPKVKAKPIGAKIKGVGRAIKKERLSKTLKLPDTAPNKVAEARRLFKDPVGFDDMVEEVSKIKGVSSNNTPKTNILLIGKEFDKTDKKLLMQLRTKPIKVSDDLIDNTVDLHLAKLKAENSWLASDASISAAFDNNVKLLQETINKFPKTPEGILLARRAFDKKLNKAALAAKAPESELIARDAVSRVLRRSLNDVVSKSAKGVDVDKFLAKERMMYKALDNLAESHGNFKPVSETIKDFAKGHPYISYGFLRGAGLSGGVMAAVANPIVAGGAVAGATLVGANRNLPSILKGVGSGARGLGMFTDATKLPIARSTAFFGKEEEQQ